MNFILNSNTSIIGNTDSVPVRNAINILKRDISKVFNTTNDKGGDIVLEFDNTVPTENFEINISKSAFIKAGDDLGFIYGLLYISSEFLGIKPFWFWMNQKIKKIDSVSPSIGKYTGQKPLVKYRGWFVNDEVLIMKWNINGDREEPWKMVFETLLRCGGNTVIPGTDKNSKIYRKIAADMGLWITHHHAEPLGAEMFLRAYPDEQPNYSESKEKFLKLWEAAVKEQKDMNVIWALGFRGQGDCPFWSSDSSGNYDTPQKRGKLISEIINTQKEIVEKYVKEPVFCTNLYGEITELYDGGHIELSEDIIKICADNGYGKMVARRQDNHSSRISSLPSSEIKHGGIYYHVSFYDLQAANHITMLQNSIDFVSKELDEVIMKNAVDLWIVNCSNVKPHVYYLDAIRKKWFGKNISDTRHSVEFSDEYYGGNNSVAECLREYTKAAAPYGSDEDEHCGEQFYNENVRLLINQYIVDKTKTAKRLCWLTGDVPLDKQVEIFTGICSENLDKMSAYYNKCVSLSNRLSGDIKDLFDETILLQSKIHYNCMCGAALFGTAYKQIISKNYLQAFMDLGRCVELYRCADAELRNSEHGVWDGFYFNECLTDIKHTAYTLETLMRIIRELGDNSRHDKWYRLATYSREDRDIMTLLVNDNHMTDFDLYKAFKNKENSKK